MVGFKVKNKDRYGKVDLIIVNKRFKSHVGVGFELEFWKKIYKKTVNGVKFYDVEVVNKVFIEDYDAYNKYVFFDEDCLKYLKNHIEKLGFEVEEVISNGW